MHHALRQSELARRKNLDRFYKAQAAKELMVFIQFLREEIFSHTYTSLEETFYKDDDEGAVLAFIHKGVEASLKDLDLRWQRAILTNAKVVPAHAFRFLQKENQESKATKLDVALCEQIRNDVIDLIAQYAQEHLKLSHERVQEWVNGLVLKLDPDVIISEARRRSLAKKPSSK